MKILKVLAAAIVVGVLVGLALPEIFPEEKVEAPLRANRRDVMAGLLACLTADLCDLKRSVETLEGQTLYGVYHKVPAKGMNVKYVLQTGSAAMTIIVVVDQQNQVSINDLDMDGIADEVTEITDGRVAKFGPHDEVHRSDYVASQLLYEWAMQQAWDNVIPEAMKKGLREDADPSRFRT